jgi:hypothetical protein
MKKIFITLEYAFSPGMENECDTCEQRLENRCKIIENNKGCIGTLLNTTSCMWLWNLDTDGFNGTRIVDIGVRDAV